MNSPVSVRCPDNILDIEIYEEYGKEHWAQARYLVHTQNDAFWTNDPKEAIEALKDAINAL